MNKTYFLIALLTLLGSLTFKIHAQDSDPLNDSLDVLDAKYDHYYDIWYYSTEEAYGQYLLLEEFWEDGDTLSNEYNDLLDEYNLLLEDMDSLGAELSKLENQIAELEAILYGYQLICDASFSAYVTPNWTGSGPIEVEFHAHIPQFIDFYHSYVEYYGVHSWTFGNDSPPYEGWHADWIFIEYDTSGVYEVTHTLEIFDTTCTTTIEVEVDYDGSFQEPDGHYEEPTFNDSCLVDFYHFTENFNDPYTIKFEGIAGWYGEMTNINYLWDFGDGSLGVGEEVSHTYSEAGTYEVTVAGSDLEGCNALLKWDIYVSDSSTLLSGDEWYGDVEFSSIYGWVGAEEFATIVTDVLVTLYAYDDEIGQLIPIEEQYVNSVGWFEFDVDPGMYAVYAQVLEESAFYGELFSGYFSTSESFDWEYESPETWTAHVALSWEDASIISVSENNGEFIGIELLPGSMDLTGDGKINGIITHEGDSGVNQKIPVHGATVILLDENGVPLTSVVTDENGQYEFTGLQYDSYKVWTEVWGHETTPIDVAISEQQKIASDIDVLVEDVDIIGTPNGLKKVSHIRNVSSIYPNPANAHVILSIETQKTMIATINISNLVGQVVYSKSETLNTGDNKVSIDVRNIPVGNYQIEVSNAWGTLVATQQFAKAE